MLIETGSVGTEVFMVLFSLKNADYVLSRQVRRNLGRLSACGYILALPFVCVFARQCFYFLKVIGAYWPTALFIIANGPGGES